MPSPDSPEARRKKWVAAGGRGTCSARRCLSGKASAGEDHRAGANLQRAAVATYYRARNAIVVGEQTFYRRVKLKIHTRIQRRTQEAGDQRVAVNQMLSAAGAQPLPAVTQQAAVAYSAERAERVALKKCAISVPPAMPIPARLMVSSGGRRRCSQSPSNRPSKAVP